MCKLCFTNLAIFFGFVCVLKEPLGDLAAYLACADADGIHRIPHVFRTVNEKAKSEPKRCFAAGDGENDGHKAEDDHHNGRDNKDHPF